MANSLIKAERPFLGEHEAERQFLGEHEDDPEIPIYTGRGSMPAIQAAYAERSAVMRRNKRRYELDRLLYKQELDQLRRENLELIAWWSRRGPLPGAH